MRWSEVREAHPEQWLVIEALEAHSERGRRVFDRVAVVEVCPDGRSSMKRYAELHVQQPGQELSFVHTAREALEFEERRWLGVRGTCGADPAT